MQLLPFAELVALSDRGGGLPLELSAMHSVGVGDLAGLVAPEPGAFELAAEGARGQRYMRLQYQGMVTLVAALAAVFGWAGLTRVERRTVGLAAAVFVGGWVLAAGDGLPVFPLLHGSGLLASMRYPAKFILPVSAAFALLAAHGVGRLGPRHKAMAGATLGVAVVCLLGYAVSADGGWLHSAVFAGVTAFLLLWRPTVPRLVVVALALDLLIAHALIQPTLPAAELLADFDAARTVRQADSRVYTRPYTQVDMDREAALASADDLGVISRLRVLDLMGNLPMAMGVRSTRGGAALRPARQAEILEQMDRGPAGIGALRFAAAGYFVSRDPLRAASLEPVAVAPPPHLYRVEGALPRHYVSCSWRGGSEEAAWQAADVAGGATVVVGAEDLSELPPSAPSAPAVGGDAVTPRRSEPDRRAFDVRAPADCIFVLVESSYPGWTARVDGEPVRVMRANGHWIGVPVPEGTSRVDLEFRPASLRRGAAISLLALLGTIIWAWRLRRRDVEPLAGPA
jgi:hypothetical protein